ncbi:MAG: DEAD/DEAH box helicase [Bacteroidetes bacterium]|nr:DEAD/DEAH box helicase [Bacteroidota bacterium]
MKFNEIISNMEICNALHVKGYTEPTPIQEQAIPHILEGSDVFGCAQTGTGKTAAFALPILQLLSNTPHQGRDAKIRAVVLAPTRELAIQINQSFTDYGKGLRLRNTVIYGGVSQHPQTNALKAGVDILVATPGRLIDLIDQGFVHLKHVEFLVLDEADRMLDMGFIHDIKRVIKLLPVKRQTVFFSATIPLEISKLAGAILNKPIQVNVAPVSAPAEKVSQCVYFIEKTEKRSLLFQILTDDKIDHALIFARTKRGADRIAKDLTKKGIKAEAIHGDKSQGSRERALDGFKNRRIRILVATDIASRGIDVDKLSHVINFDLPEVPETYIHRIGRTARAGEEGAAISFCSPDELPYLKDIRKLVPKDITSMPHTFSTGSVSMGNSIAASTHTPMNRGNQQRNKPTFRRRATAKA